MTAYLQDLLSKGFRTQMLMDGQFGSISFVVTKTDDINSQETLNTLSVVCTSPQILAQEYGCFSCRAICQILQCIARQAACVRMYAVSVTGVQTI